MMRSKSATDDPFWKRLPNLEHIEHSKVIRYLALGDSFTIGTGGPPERSFPARLAELWRARGLPVTLLNLGIDGYRTEDLVRDELPRVRAFAPSIATLLIGTNDLVAGRSAEAFRRRLREILVRLRDDRVDPARILVICAPDWSRAPQARLYGDPARVARQVDDYATVTAREAEAATARFFDLVPLSRRQSEESMFAPDRLHFSADAYVEWAEAFDAALAAWGLP